MRTVNIWGREVKAQGSPLALVIYREAFDSDFHKDAYKAYKGVDPEAEEKYPVSQTFLLQALWAMASTFDRDTPDFKTWLDGFDETRFTCVSSQEWIGEVDAALSAEMFREIKTKSRRPGGIRGILGRIRQFGSRSKDGI